MMSASVFLRRKGVNHSFMVDGGSFKGDLLSLFRLYDLERCVTSELTPEYIKSLKKKYDYALKENSSDIIQSLKDDKGYQYYGLVRELLDLVTGETPPRKQTN